MIGSASAAGKEASTGLRKTGPERAFSRASGCRKGPEVCHASEIMQKAQWLKAICAFCSEGGGFSLLLT
jgi:hypothetical protein